MTKDYEVVNEIKHGINVSENELFLFEKYQPLIKKMGNRFCTVYAHSNMNFNDFVQDSYFTIVKLLKWIDLEKVSNPNVFFFSVPLAWALKTQIKKSFKHYVKPSGSGTRVFENGRTKFYNHDMNLNSSDDLDDRDIIEDSVALNRVDPVYSQVAYDVLLEYVDNHDEVLKNPITLQDELTYQRYTEKPLKSWQLQYIRKILDGMSIQDIETEYRDKPKDSEEWVAAKQEWFRTRRDFEKFIKERINRAIDLNVVEGV